MKRLLKLISLMVAVAALTVSASLPGTYAKPEYSKKEKKSCKHCHTSSKPNKDDLNDAGKYYRDHKTLEGYKPKA